MIDFTDNNNIYERLTSLCDGELSSADADELRRHVSAHPELADWLEVQQRLTQAASRVIREQSTPAPHALRERIRAISAVANPSLSERAARSPRSARPPRFVLHLSRAVAAAALLGIGIWMGRFLLQPKLPSSVVQQVPVVPASIVAHASAIHADCSRLQDAQHAAAFPEGPLSADVRHDLDSEKPYPDLSSMGFFYVGAGPCGHPLQGAIHLLYRTTDPHSRAVVSIFVQRFDGQFSMQPGTLYTLSSADSPFPMLGWRTTKVVYLLVADNSETLSAARRLIRGAPSP